MGYIATFDIGTTALKGALISTAGKSVREKSIPLETIFKGDYKEQNPLTIDRQINFFAAHRDKRIVNTSQISGNKSKKVRGFRDRIFPDFSGSWSALQE